MNALNSARTGSLVLAGSGGSAPQGVELRHLRYFVAVADAGTFTHAAERMFIAQPTLSQQIRRLEEMVGTPLLQRRREGVRLTDAGAVLLEESRTVLSLIDHGVSRTRQAAAGEALPGPLEVMSLGDFEPDVWLPPDHRAASRGVISLGELAGMDVIHGPRRFSTAIYDAWLAVMRAANPRFDFTDPPFRRSLPMTLAFVATASRPTAVLTGPQHRIVVRPAPTGPRPAAGAAGMVRARAEGCPFAATASLVWSADLQRQLQQVLFDTADSTTF